MVQKSNVSSLDIDDHDGSTDGLFLAGTLVTSTPAELNIMDGVTSTAAELNILDGVTSTAAELNYLDLTTLGTGAASKAVVLDAGDDYTWPAAGVLTHGKLNDATTELAATHLELNRTCDVSGRMVAGGGTLSLTVALHDGKTIAMDTAAGTVLTLPAASGTGAIFKIVITVTATSNSHVIQVANSSDTFKGTIFTLSDASDLVEGWLALAASDTITFNRTTTGTAAVGQYVEVQDVLTNVWSVRGFTASTGEEATPFSAAV